MNDTKFQEIESSDNSYSSFGQTTTPKSIFTSVETLPLPMVPGNNHNAGNCSLPTPTDNINCNQAMPALFERSQSPIHSPNDVHTVTSSQTLSTNIASASDFSSIAADNSKPPPPNKLDISITNSLMEPVTINLPTSDEELMVQKQNSKMRHLTINGGNVTPESFEDGYVQFILHHDPDSINDGIDSLVYTRRKFSSVPRTGDLSYTAWDIFVLVNKLHNQEIKNWSQLVGQLGLSDMMGRPQFAQRVKRWMHKYKIDYYFDYLMGIPFDFHSDDEKYSGCLMMGNYQKRFPENITDGTNVKKRRRVLYSVNTSTSTTMEVVDPEIVEIDKKRPVLMAGSRKRGRDASQTLALANDLPRRPTDGCSMIPMHYELFGDSEANQDLADSLDEDKQEPATLDKQLEKLYQMQPNNHIPSVKSPPLRNRNDDCEEDELASSSSTSGSPLLPKLRLPELHSTPSPSLPMHGCTDEDEESSNCVCSSCQQLAVKVRFLQSKLDTISSQWETWKSNMDTKHKELQTQVAALADEKEKLQEQWMAWRKKIVTDLLSGPFS
ncbi:hypothetical protein DM01DRAFT_303564 [Hesseltinella vesiculosa]|uniref:Uncharacterized protein n=1 Tax=Hesseltinella vesiculosa TaxID=101127 RepID=A0A1X2GNB7_9FUNG|nr:hypothetical protein DM01DRAFT_303564 [Hesseltinella vesiculosa]